MNSILKIVCFVAISFLYFGCEKSHVHDHVEHGVPSKIVFTFIPEQSIDTLRATWSDMDGEGGNAPIIDTIKLKQNRTYFGSVTITTRDGKDLTSIIRAEAQEHQFFYTTLGDISNDVTTSILDRDSKNLPLGLSFQLQISQLQSMASKSGFLKVVLSHYDDIVKDGLKPSPESDIDIQMPVVILQ